MPSPAFKLRVAALAALLLTGQTGCVVTMQPPVVTASAPVYAEVVVPQGPPPPPRQEVVVQAPSPSHAWVAGHWEWHGQWVWTPGYWIVRPQPYAVWTPGYWQPHHHGWVWVPGYWR